MILNKKRNTYVLFGLGKML
jgi:hypothetical protein